MTVPTSAPALVQPVYRNVVGPPPQGRAAWLTGKTNFPLDAQLHAEPAQNPSIVAQPPPDVWLRRIFPENRQSWGLHPYVKFAQHPPFAKTFSVLTVAHPVVDALTPAMQLHRASWQGGSGF